MNDDLSALDNEFGYRYFKALFDRQHSSENAPFIEPILAVTPIARGQKNAEHYRFAAKPDVNFRLPAVPLWLLGLGAALSAGAQIRTLRTPLGRWPTRSRSSTRPPTYIARHGAAPGLPWRSDPQGDPR